MVQTLTYTLELRQDGENILDIDWTLQSREQTVAPDDRNFREYRYLIGGLTGTT